MKFMFFSFRRFPRRWKNGEHCVRSHDGDTFYSLREAQVLIERWRVHYNTLRPHSSLGYRPPTPAVVENRELTSLANAIT